MAQASNLSEVSSEVAAIQTGVLWWLTYLDRADKSMWVTG